MVKILGRTAEGVVFGIGPGADLCSVGFSPSGQYTPPDEAITAVFVVLLQNGARTDANVINDDHQGNWSATFPDLQDGDYSFTVAGTVNKNTVSPLHFRLKFCPGK